MRPFFSYLNRVWWVGTLSTDGLSMNTISLCTSFFFFGILLLEDWTFACWLDPLCPQSRVWLWSWLAFVAACWKVGNSQTISDAIVSNRWVCWALFLASCISQRREILSITFVIKPSTVFLLLISPFWSFWGLLFLILSTISPTI